MLFDSLSSSYLLYFIFYNPIVEIKSNNIFKTTFPFTVGTKIT